MRLSAESRYATIAEVSSGVENEWIDIRCYDTPALVTGTSITGVTNVASTKLGLTVVVDPNAWGYEIQLNTATGTWAHWETFTDPHDITLLNLVPGTLYGIRARVLGAGNQRSEWSEPVSHMAT